MKKNLPAIFAFTACLFASNLQAQITVTQSDFANIGDTITLATDTLLASSIGATGPWDFSNFQVDEMGDLVFVDPDSTFTANDFPNSNLAAEDGQQTTYINSDSTMVAINGFYGDPFGVGVPLAVKFNPSSTMIQFPANYNDTYQDTSAFLIKEDASAAGIPLVDSVMIIHSGYATVTNDAFGDVYLNSDTFDCLRQYTMEITVDSIFIYSGGGWGLAPAFPGFLDENPIVDTTYTLRWFANGEGFSLVEMEVESDLTTPIEVSYILGPNVAAGLMTITDVDCNGDCDGDATVMAVNGVSPYSYTWDNGQTDATATGLCAGIYDVTITDGIGNTAMASATVWEPTALSTTTSTVDAHCDTCSEGSATVVASGGTGVLTYSWSNGGAGAQINNLTPGAYTVTVTDENGCQIIATATVGAWATGIMEVEKVQFNMYPNPANGKLFVNANQPIEHIGIYNLIGELVFQEQPVSQSLSVDCSHLPEGVYLLQLTSKGANFTRKLSIIR